MDPENTEQPTILIVDDTPENLEVLIMALEHSGFRIAVAQSGEATLKRMEYTLPDLILLDVIMPGIDGFETCRRLKAHEATKDIPVIFMTALSETVEKVTGFEVGGVDYLTKPVQHDELIARVNTHLTIRTLQRQLQEQHDRFQTLADATFEGIIIHRDGEILEVNRAIEQMSAYRRSELIGREMLEFVPPHWHNKLEQFISTDTTRPYEAQAIKKSREVFPIEVSAKTMLHHEQSLQIVAVRDLSWRKALEEEKSHLEKENLTLRTTIKDRYKFGEIIGKSPAMQEIYELLVHTAATDADVVISGESGTGKELIARTIHQISDRRNHSFVPLNCGAIPDTLFESEFFGYRKGAFTGADRHKAGYFDQAHQGILFLDEVGELSPLLQVKLLRAIDDGEYMPVGSNTPKRVDVRIISATNKDLEEQVRRGEMREDFFFRLNVISIKLPPLRDRREDLPLLIEHFLEKQRKNRLLPILPGRVYQILLHHDWPGNIRELQNVLQRYLAVKRLEFPGSQSPAYSLDHENCPVLETVIESHSLQGALETFEKQFLQKMLQQHQWHKSETAQALGVGRKTLYRKMKQFGLI